MDMRRENNRFRDWLVIGMLLIGIELLALKVAGGRAAVPDTFEVNDAHVHLTNYVQEGVSIHDFVNIMGTKVGRAVLFGIPLQQQWAYAARARFEPPITCKPARPPTTTRSPTPSTPWRTGR